MQSGKASCRVKLDQKQFSIYLEANKLICKNVRWDKIRIGIHSMQRSYNSNCQIEASADMSKVVSGHVTRERSQCLLQRYYTALIFSVSKSIYESWPYTLNIFDKNEKLKSTQYRRLLVKIRTLKIWRKRFERHKPTFD